MGEVLEETGGKAGPAESFERFSDELIAELRAEIGKPIPGPPGFVEYATPDTIRHWAMAVGDYNPLWLDPAYGAAGAAGAMVAPPSMLFAFNKVGWGARGLGGIHSMFSGGGFEWRRPIVAGDRISSETRLKDIVEISNSKFAGRAYKQIRHTSFTDESGAEVAVAEPYSWRMERDRAREINKYERLKPALYSEREYDEIAEASFAEEPRGGRPRFWEDVRAGDPLGQVVRGPLTVTDIIVFLTGFGGQWIRAHADAARWYKRHPKGAIRNANGALEPPEIVHWEDWLARRVGVPAAYDYGPQRVSWLITLLTNWCGDDGFVRSFDCQLRRFTLVGDTTWVTGTVAGKRQQDGAYLVDCTIDARDQRGEETARATAVIQLPARATTNPTAL